MLQGLIDIRNKAHELAKKSTLGVWEPYPISCNTLIAILDELEAVEQERAIDPPAACEDCGASAIIVHEINCPSLMSAGN